MAVSSAGSSTSKGIDVATIVSGLMEVERAPVTKLQSQIDQKTLVISTLGVFKSKVSALESAAKAIQTPGVYSLRSASSSDSTKVSATASNAATAGAYTVKVAQTAQSETSMIGGFTSASQVVNLSGFSLTTKEGTSSPVTYSPSYLRVGSLSFSAGDKILMTLKGGDQQSFTVSSQTTPASVASAINAAVTAGTLKDVSATVDASGYLQISSSNPLRGLAGSLQIPGYAGFSSSATFASGDAIRFTTSGGSEQTFLVTSQNTASKVATAINDAVLAGSLSGVTASVAGGALRLTAKDPTVSVTATLNGSGTGITAVAATGSSVINYSAGTTTAKVVASPTDVGGKVLLTTSSIAAGDVIKYTIEDGVEQTFTVTTQATVADIATAIAAASSGAITAADVGGKLELTSTATEKNITGSYGDKLTGISSVSTGLTTTATVSNVAGWINALAADLEATVVQRADGKFALNVSAKETGAANAFSISGITTPDAQKDKITLSGTFAVDDAIVLNVNGEPLIYKVVSNDLTADGAGGGGAVSGSSATAYANIAAKIAAAYNLTKGSSTKHNPVTASSDGSAITLLADTPGTAFTATSQVSKKSASVWTATANAPAVAQVDKIQLSGTYAVGDVVSLTVNGVAISHTVTANNLTLNDDGVSAAVSGSSAAAYQNIATAIAAAYNASTNTAHTPITASASGAVISLTADSAGTGFTTASSITPAGPVAIRAASVANSTSPNTAQVDTIALSGKYTAGDILKVTVGGVALNYTITAADVVGGGNTSADYERIAQSFAAAYNASTNTAHTPVTAASTGGVISLTADTAGTAFIAAASVTTSSVATGSATRTAVVANVADRGLTSVGAGSASAAAAATTAVATRAASVGNGVAVAQQDTVTLSGTYALGETLAITVGGVALNYTIQAADVIDGGNSANDYQRIAQAFVLAYNGSANPAHTPVTASSVGAVITLTADTAGTAFTASAATTGSGAVALAHPVANVAAVAQKDTVTLSGTYAAGETLAITVGGVALNYTIQAADVIDGGSSANDYQRIAQAFVLAYNGSANPAHTPVTASSVGAVITFTADTAGTAFTASAATAGASSITNGTYTATYNGSAWVVSAPSGTYTAGLASGTLTITNGSNTLSVAGVTGTPKAGDRISLAVTGGGSGVVATLFEHAAIELQSSRDAFFSINGTAVQRSSNKVEDVISGVTFNLDAPVVPAGGAIASLASADFAAATSTVITVSSGTQDLATSAVTDFVTAYNDLLTFYKEQAVSSTDSKKRGVLNTDSSLRTYMERLRSLYGRGVRLADGSTMNFNTMGVEIQRDGSLYLDKGALNTAVANGLQNKFADGVTLGYESATSNFTSFLTSSLKAKTGLLTSHISDTENQQSEIQKKIDDWEVRLGRIQDRYYRQYAALDALIFKLQNTSDALGSAIESLVNSQKNG